MLPVQSNRCNSNASCSAWCSSSALSLLAHVPRTRTLTHLPTANLRVARTISFTGLGRPTPSYRVILPPSTHQRALVQLGHFVCTKPRHAPAHVPSTMLFSGILYFAPALPPLVGPQVRRFAPPSPYVPHQSNQFGVCMQVHRPLIPPTDSSNSSQWTPRQRSSTNESPTTKHSSRHASGSTAVCLVGTHTQQPI